RRFAGALAETLEHLAAFRGACPKRLLLVVHGTALGLVRHGVDRGLVGGPGSVAPERLAIDDEGRLGDVRIRRAPVLLHGELEEGLAAVVKEALDPVQLALRIPTHTRRDVDVLAPDNSSHGNPRPPDPAAR